MLTIVETRYFQTHWPKYWQEADHHAFIEFIRKAPNAGVVVPKSGGIRKVRWTRPGMGKSSGVRVIYFIRNAEDELVLLTIYAKAALANLTAAQLKELRREYERKPTA
ncbi:type II toxin-antitoxin system RelE/ParE family toxin [Duganella callida]|uniref:Transcriptional regulator n=1 Tax=Duganella callida TaxID=2561932 RepID=A0A4Y9SLA2_9BURK|nr:type II toxin-antitoxin system RelE/ParE family toxin [Duganella callida]TFW27221.1 transcriptional regulator [Duganella callida]